MDRTEATRAVAAARRTSAVVVGALASVGAFELGGTVVPALLAVGFFGSLIASVNLWQEGRTGRALWGGVGRSGWRACLVLLVLVGSVVTLDDLHLFEGLLALAVWWALRPDARVGRGRRLGRVLGGRVGAKAALLPGWFAQASASSTAQAPGSPPDGSSSSPPATSSSEGSPPTGSSRSDSTPASSHPASSPLDSTPTAGPSPKESSPREAPSTPPALPRPPASASGGSSTGAETSSSPGEADQRRRTVRGLDDASLALAWTQARAAREPRDPAGRVELAALRQLLLDELERRDPVAFAAWLAEGAPDDRPPLATGGRS